MRPTISADEAAAAAKKLIRENAEVFKCLV
jgi:hypothetical protein